MKYAVIADIHGNLDALDVVLADAREQKCTHYCCVGDVVGYGANPATSATLRSDPAESLRMATDDQIRAELDRRTPSRQGMSFAALLTL